MLPFCSLSLLCSSHLEYSSEVQHPFFLLYDSWFVILFGDDYVNVLFSLRVVPCVCIGVLIEYAFQVFDNLPQSVVDKPLPLFGIS